MNKIIYKMLCFIIILSLVGCGNAVSTMNDEESEENREVIPETVDETGIDIDDESVADVISDLPAEVVEEIIEDDLVPTSSGLDLEDDVVEPEPEVEPEPHVHQYVESITVQPTCAVAGEKTLVCECGDAMTESVPATGVHNWVEQTTLVHHDELGHVEQSQVLVGWTEPHTEYECSYCGHRENTPWDLQSHWKSYIPEGNFDHVFARTFAYDYPAEPIYETQSKWVVDTPAWDETVVVGYTCSVCGATQ